MSPTNFGALPSNLPFPNQRVQVKRGIGSSLTYDVSNLVASGTKLTDGAGGSMEISYQPRYACYWLVRANLICKARSDAADWRRCDFGLSISPADANGITLGHSRPTNNYPTLEWRSCSMSYMFKLNPGITYTAAMVFQYSTGYWQQYHVHPYWIRIFGVVLGEGEE